MVTQIPHRDQVVLSLTVSELSAGHLPAQLLGSDGMPEHSVLIVDLDSVSEASPEEIVAAARTCQSFESAVRIGAAQGVMPAEQLSGSGSALIDALDIIVVGKGTALAELSCCVGVPSVPEAIAQLTSVVSAHPTAATFLVQVLRAGQHASLLEAVNIESFAFSALLRSSEYQFWLSDVRDSQLVPPEIVEHPVLVDRTGNELVITLNRPERRNAYGRQLRDALADALRVALIDSTIERVHLCGAGRAFSSGGELSEFGLTPDVGSAHFIRTRAGVGHLIAALGDRLTVEVHGACIGAGIEIAAFGARVVARGNTIFKLPEVGMGLIPGAGGTASISRRIGRHRTAWLALSADSISQDRALDWGLVDELT